LQGWLTIGSIKIPLIATELTVRDHFGAWMARWGIGRMKYIVPAGLYAIGSPTEDSPVLVTANYKMSYDIVRSSLVGRSLWLLVLETYGINVWCAAGKGTFGTDELVRQIETSRLSQVVNHRRILLPILGAPGVAAHEVTRRTGFTVHYATLRAADLPEYLDNGMVTTAKMRELSFSFGERLVLVPVELVHALKSLSIIGILIFLIAALLNGYTAGITMLIAYFGAVLTGILIAPLLLPWLPGRSFAVKGAQAGLGWTGLFYFMADGQSWGAPVIVAAFLALPAISSFYMLNFTGCTTFTSRSGVKKEMRIAIPVIAASVCIGVLLLLSGLLRWH
jgi:hypothetical protein